MQYSETGGLCAVALAWKPATREHLERLLTRAEGMVRREEQVRRELEGVVRGAGDPSFHTGGIVPHGPVPWVWRAIEAVRETGHEAPMFAPIRPTAREAADALGARMRDRLEHEHLFGHERLAIWRLWCLADPEAAVGWLHERDAMNGRP